MRREAGAPTRATQPLWPRGDRAWIDLNPLVPLSRGFESGTPVPEPMHLSGHYSNHSPAFTGVLDAFLGGIADQAGRDRPVPDAPKTHRAGNGVIQRAVIKALSEADRPMDVGEARTAVEGLLGYPVSRDSVCSCLSTGARSREPQFERVARGCYRLIRPHGAYEGREDS